MTIRSLAFSLLFIFCFFTSTEAFCQVHRDSLPAIQSIDLTGLTWGDLYVRTTDGILLREKPSVRSKAICSIPFGEKVKFVDDWNYTYGYDSAEFDLDWSVYEYHPNWVIVSYGGYKGFAFRGYLSESRTSVYDKDHSPVQLLFEGSQCVGDIAYNPDFYWYGCYLIPSEDSEYTVIKPVKIKITTFDGEDGATSTIVTTDQPSQAKFLFGMDKEIIPQKRVKSTFFDMATKIYPGQRLHICQYSSLYATGCADTTIVEYGNYVKNYKLMVQNGNKVQDLTNDFNFKAESGYNILSWLGDLNGDNSPDAIFTTGGYHGETISLYIGSDYFNDDRSVMKKVSTIKLYGCY